MKVLKNFGVKLLGILGLGLICLLLGAAFIYGVAWVFQWLALDGLIEDGVITNAAEFWHYTLIFYVVIILLPIHMLIFRAFPMRVQGDTTGAAKGLALGMLYLGDWIGKGVLLAGGAYLFYIAFAV